MAKAEFFKPTSPVNPPFIPQNHGLGCHQKLATFLQLIYRKTTLKGYFRLKMTEDKNAGILI
jgi:hypothetical protein